MAFSTNAAKGRGNDYVVNTKCEIVLVLHVGTLLHPKVDVAHILDIVHTGRNS